MKVLIIGNGLAGLMAASQLAGPLLEKRDNNGKHKIQIEIIGDGNGASPFVHGFNMPLFEKDSEEIFLSDTMAGGYELSCPELVEVLCRDSLKLLPDLEKLGIHLEKKNGNYMLLQPLGSTWPRVAGSGNHTGTEILNCLTTLLKQEDNVSFVHNTRALRLDVYEGRVKGVYLWNKKKDKLEYRSADCVLLANGGFCGIYPFSTNPPDSGGDGIAMAFEAGIPLVDMEFVQFEPSVALYPEKLRGKSVITTMFYEGAVLRNRYGERFMMKTDDCGEGECVNKDILSRKIYEEIQSGHGTTHNGVYFDATKVGRYKLEEKYNAYVKRYMQVGIDISKEPFEIAPGPHTSLGGIMISPDGRTSIKGVWAAGEVTGGIHGANRIGGNAGLEVLVFGKRAGKDIGRYLEKNEDKPNQLKADYISEPSAELFNNRRVKNSFVLETCELIAMRKEMQEILGKNLYIIRNGPMLSKALLRLETMLETIKISEVYSMTFEKIRLENDLICASLLTRAALNRKESVGCHIRADSVMKDHHYHIMLQKGKEGTDVKYFTTDTKRGYISEADNS